MRVSLVARYVSHPTIDFGSGRRSARRARLGLVPSPIVYHVSRRAVGALPSIRALRVQTSEFRFPSVGRVGRVHPRRSVPSFGLSRARRA